MAPDTPLPYRLRSEIEWTFIRGKHRHSWVAKDPLRSHLFRCGDEVRKLLQSLDGKRSIDDLKRMSASNVVAKRISTNAIHQIVLSAIQKQLLIRCDADNRSHDSATDAPELRSTAVGWMKSIQRWPWFLVQGKQSLGNLERFLHPLARRTNWLFGSWAVKVWITSIVISAILVVSRIISQDMPIWPSMAAIESNFTNYLLILLSTRILHELGHAIVCIRMGARCREFGIFFMLGVACPYVDVTDSWRISDHRARMAIAAAGVYVEWIIAAVAGLIWYASQPCWLHTFAWQVMAICSLTTFLINANPLMRYDGYYLLSDFLEVANLREEANDIFKKFVRVWCLGERTKADECPLSWSDCGLILYACSSWIYRSTLIIALVYSVHVIAVRWHLPILGWAFATLSIVSFLLIPLGQKMFQTWSVARRTSRGPYRVVALWMGCVALIANAGWLPMPYRIACQGSVQPEHRTFVYTQTAGRIPLELEPRALAALEVSDHSIVRLAPAAHSASCLAILENPWIEDQARMATQRQHQLECQVVSLRQAAYQQSSVMDRLPTLTTMVEIAKKKSLNATKELEALAIAKPSPGSWVAIELPPLESLDGITPSMQGHTIEASENRGRWLPAGTPIGYVTPTENVSIAATIPISQLSSIQLGMSARVRFDQLPNRVFSAKVVEISGLTSTPDSVVRSRTLSHASGSGLALDSRSHVSISLAVYDASQKLLAMGGTAEIVIWSAPKSLYDHAMHFAGATFGPSGSQTISR